MVSCSYANSIWVRSSFGDLSSRASDLREWWLDLVDRFPNSDLNLAATILWGIWRNRNERVWKGKSRPAAFLLAEALSINNQWQEVQAHKFSPHQMSHPTYQEKWSRPPTGFIKCNVDASISEHSCRMGVGSVVRDSTGAFQMAFHSYQQGLFDPFIAEAVALRETLYWLISKACSHVILESDC